MPPTVRRLILLVLLAALLAACAGPPSGQAPTAASAPDAAPAAAPTNAAADSGLTVIDALGRSVTVAATPQRIVSLAPSVTEILFAAGAGPQVVGNTEFCNYPPEADALPEIGGFSTDSISVEAIVGLQPDLVIAGAASQQPVVEQLEQLGLTVLVLAPDSFEAVYDAIAQTGAVTGHRAEADQLVAGMRGRVDAVTAAVATVPDAARPSVYWEVFDEPLIAAGPATFMGQMIDLAGATNIFADATEDYPQVSAEAVLERDPQVILGPTSQRLKLTVEAIGQRPGWADIQAVRDGRVYLLDDDIVARPGPRLADALEALALALYPEAFN